MKVFVIPVGDLWYCEIILKFNYIYSLMNPKHASMIKIISKFYTYGSNA